MARKHRTPRRVTRIARHSGARVSAIDLAGTTEIKKEEIFEKKKPYTRPVVTRPPAVAPARYDARVRKGLAAFTCRRARRPGLITVKAHGNALRKYSPGELFLSISLSLTLLSARAQSSNCIRHSPRAPVEHTGRPGNEGASIEGIVSTSPGPFFDVSVNIMSHHGKRVESVVAAILRRVARISIRRFIRRSNGACFPLLFLIVAARVEDNSRRSASGRSNRTRM